MARNWTDDKKRKNYFKNCVNLVNLQGGFNYSYDSLDGYFVTKSWNKDPKV